MLLVMARYLSVPLNLPTTYVRYSSACVQKKGVHLASSGDVTLHNKKRAYIASVSDQRLRGKILRFLTLLNRCIVHFEC